MLLIDYVVDGPEFVLIRKKFRFMMEIFYLGVNKFKYIRNCLGQRFQ